MSTFSGGKPPSKGRVQGGSGRTFSRGSGSSSSYTKKPRSDDENSGNRDGNRERAHREGDQRPHSSRPYGGSAGSFKPRENRPSEGFKPRENRSSEGYKPRENRSSEGYKPRENRPSEGYKPRENRPSEGFKPRENRSSEGFKPRENRSSEGYKPRENRSSEGYKPRENRSSEGYKPRENRPSEGFKPRENRPSEGFKPRENRSSEGIKPRESRTFNKNDRSYSSNEPAEKKLNVRGEVNEREDFREMDRAFSGKIRGPRYQGPDSAVSIEDGSILSIQSEPDEAEDRIEGRNPVLEAFKAGHEMNKILIEKETDDATLLKISAMAREIGVPVIYVDRRKLDTMSLTRAHQGVIAEVAAHAYVEIEDMVALAKEKGEEPFLVVLDGVTDPNNLGSVIRSAECAGAHGVIIPKRRAVALNATVAKVAAGAHEHIAVGRVSNIVSTLKLLKEQGLWIAAADAGAEKTYTDTDLKGPMVLVVGGEGEGISRIVLKECDLQVKIPMHGKIASLNAGVAAALVLFEVARQRGMA